jgi:hypothetical protein
LKSFALAPHDVGMPRRVAAVSTEFLLREVSHLDDSVLLLPQQVFIMTGLSLGMLKERMRTRPPQPPHPMPREKSHTAIWYSLGEIRRFLRERAENAELDRAIAMKHRSFSMWINTAAPNEPWPITLVGPHRKPVDFFAALRGEVPTTRSDRSKWMTLSEYMAAMKQAIALVESEELA